MFKKFKFINNQMESETRNSFRKAVVLSKFQDAGLLALIPSYPALQARYDLYHPAHELLVSGYNNWDSTEGVKQGDRVTVELLFTGAKLQLTDVWLPAILMFYKKLSSRYKSIFPNGMKPYNVGGIDEKIESFNTLSKNIGIDTNLTTVKTAVDSTYSELKLARNAQTGAKVSNYISSDALEALRFTAMNLQYRNTGFVMDSLFEHRETILPLIIDLVTLREKEQSIYTGHILHGITIDVLAHTFLDSDSIRVKIVGSGKFKLFLSSTSKGIDSTAITIDANLRTDILVSGFNVTDFANHRFLTLMSESEDAATYRIELL